MTPLSPVHFSLAHVGLTIFLVTLCSLGCSTTTVPDLTGTWSGSMMLELAKGDHTFVAVDVTLNQDGEHLSGRWRTIGATEFGADGEVTGRIARTPSQNQVDLRFSFVGRHPSAGGACKGTAQASGQLTFNTTMNSVANPPGTPVEEAGWGLRLKAFDGFPFESCSPVRYATWTLTRKRDDTGVQENGNRRIGVNFLAPVILIPWLP
jgi:hypothetical protein